MREIKVAATIHQQVYVDPLDVLEQLHIIPNGDWITERDGKYIQMTEDDFGHRSHIQEVGEVTKEIFDLFQARKLLLTYLAIKQDLQKKEQVKKDYAYYFKEEFASFMDETLRESK